MRGRSLAALCLALAACGDDGGATPDADTGVTTDHCTYAPVAATAGSGGTVTAGALEAGAGEAVLPVPVGTALGGFTSRARSIPGSNASEVDARDRTISGSFNASVGIETAPRAKALALRAGGETVVLVKIDAIFVYEGMVFEIEERLGDAFRGKVLIAASHSHSAWMQFTGHSALKVGGGELRQRVLDGFLDGIEAAARAALDALEPARIGFFVDRGFDPDDVINRDRRGDNNGLPGGDRGDDHLTLIRVDGVDGDPIAIVPVFGEHGTLMDDVNPMASNDAPGGIERVLEEQVPGALVIHLQGAGADTSAVGHGGSDCDLPPGDPGDPCLPFATLEGHGRAAAPTLLAAWEAAGATMQTELALEMMTRSVELGPDPATFTIRDGALAYAPFDRERVADGRIYDDGGAVLSPIDEFNAPVGAALCEHDGTGEGEVVLTVAQIPGTSGLTPYASCARLDAAGEVLHALLDIEFEVAANRPVCQTTRTTMSALRLGDYVLGTVPGETSVLINDLVRARSPVDAEHTIVVGYAQGHVGYVMTPEDWLLGGYEASVTFWGPLEGEYLAERLLDLLPMAMTSDREDGAAGGTDRVATASATDLFPIDEPAPMAGTVPATVDPDLWTRGGVPAGAQPVDVERVAGLATFVWNGDDPAVQVPVVTLEREVSPGTFAPAARRSGRPVRDGDLLLTYTPVPLHRSGTDPVRHVWAVEWQAVPWLGAEGLDGLADRAGLPLGRYRFHVAGDGWTLTSDPFSVVPGGVAVTASRAGTVLTATVTLHAPRGYRLLDLAAPSNRPVPVRSQSVTVELLGAGGAVLDSRTVTTSDAGGVTFDDADVALATQVRVTDRFGNPAVVSL